MSQPPPRKKLGPPEYAPAPRTNKGVYWLIGKSAHLICSKCNNQQALIATGCTAETLSASTAIKCGLSMGWQMMPKVLCLFCATPLSSSEMFEYSDMMARIESEGPDMADIEHVRSFEEHMKHKYGLQALVHMNNLARNAVVNPNSKTT